MEADFQEWINISLRAPSGDNCQPWKLTYFESYFYITIDEILAQHFLDQNFAASWISLGCLCENLQQSALHFGFSCEISLESEMSVLVSFSRVSKVNNQKLVESIKNRATFRGKLEKVDFKIENFNQIRGDSSGFHWWQRNQISESMIDEWSTLESILWLKTPLMKDFTKWIHVNLNGYLDGVTLSNLMLNVFDQIFLLVIKLFPFMIKIIPFWFFKLNSKNRLTYLLKNSSGVVFLEGKIHKSTDFYYVGREIQSLWLYLTQQGLKAQPLAIQSLFFNYTENEINKCFLTDSQLKTIKNIKRNTKGKLGVERDIVFMLRYGQSATALDPMPRKNLENILDKKAIN